MAAVHDSPLPSQEEAMAPRPRKKRPGWVLSLLLVGILFLVLGTLSTLLAYRATPLRRAIRAGRELQEAWETLYAPGTENLRGCLQEGSRVLQSGALQLEVQRPPEGLRPGTELTLGLDGRMAQAELSMPLEGGGALPPVKMTMDPETALVAGQVLGKTVTLSFPARGMGQALTDSPLFQIYARLNPPSEETMAILRQLSPDPTQVPGPPSEAMEEALRDFRKSIRVKKSQEVLALAPELTLLEVRFDPDPLLQVWEEESFTRLSRLTGSPLLAQKLLPPAGALRGRDFTLLLGLSKAGSLEALSLRGRDMEPLTFLLEGEIHPLERGRLYRGQELLEEFTLIPEQDGLCLALSRSGKELCLRDRQGVLLLDGSPLLTYSRKGSRVEMTLSGEKGPLTLGLEPLGAPLAMLPAQDAKALPGLG